jgi:hypothetical protein
MNQLSDRLCHYTTAETAFQYILPSGKLRMSPYARMRDPLENRELFIEVDRLAGEEDGKLWHTVCDLVKRIRDRTRLLCFTVDADESDGYTEADAPFMEGWSRARMWEHYADTHAGVCVVFDRERALGHLRAELNQLGSFTADKVVYTAQGFSDTRASTLILDQFRDNVNTAASSYVVNHDKDLFFTKTLDWRSEYEFRVTLFPGQINDDFVFVSYGGAESVVAVILGERFPQWQLPAAKSVCEKAAVALGQVKWEAGMPFAEPLNG